MRIALFFTLLCLIACSGTSVRAADDNSIAITLQVPNPGHDLQLVSQHRVGDTAWILVEVTKPEPGRMHAAVITERQLDVPLPAGIEDQRVFVLGSAYQAEEQGYTRIASKEAFEKALSEATPVE